MKIIFRSEKGSNLEPSEVDNNFRLLKQAVEALGNFEILDSDKFVIDLNDNFDVPESPSYGDYYYLYGNGSGIGVDFLFIDPFLRAFSGQNANDRFLINKNGTIQIVDLGNWVGGDVQTKAITSFAASLGSNSNAMYIDGNYLTINTNNLVYGDTIDLRLVFNGYNGSEVILNLYFFVTLA